jgi:hypothetical protein
MINYVFNQSLEPKVPMIIDKLDTLHNEVSIFRESLNSYAIENKRYAKNLQLHISVMEDIKNSIASQSLIYKEMLGTFVAIKQFVKGVGLCKGGKIDKGVQETLNRWK